MPEVEEGSSAALEREQWLEVVRTDWRRAGLDAADEALCTFAEKLTRTPGKLVREDVDALRSHGFDDVALHDVVQVISYFNYINRVADAVRVELEPEMPPYPE